MGSRVVDVNFQKVINDNGPPYGRRLACVDVVHVVIAILEEKSVGRRP